MKFFVLSISLIYLLSAVIVRTLFMNPNYRVSINKSLASVISNFISKIITKFYAKKSTTDLPFTEHSYIAALALPTISVPTDYSTTNYKSAYILSEIIVNNYIVKNKVFLKEIVKYCTYSDIPSEFPKFYNSYIYNKFFIRHMIVNFMVLNMFDEFHDINNTDLYPRNNFKEFYFKKGLSKKFRDRAIKKFKGVKINNVHMRNQNKTKYLTPHE